MLPLIRITPEETPRFVLEPSNEPAATVAPVSVAFVTVMFGPD